ncbi:MAG: SPFH domain-containing protein [Ilumatobacteraceae bacterium]
MSTGAVIVFVIFAVPAIGFGLYLLLQDALVRIDTGDLGLVIRRGRPTDRTLLPGTHFVNPFGRMVIQSYPSRELVYRTTRDAASEDDTNRANDPAVGVVLGDRSHASVCFTVRFTLDPALLNDVHRRFGPDGIYSIVRDVSEQVVADRMGRDGVSYEHLFGEARAVLQADLTTAITEGLAEHGFLVSSFGLREVDLGEIGEAIQATARSVAISEQEMVAANARRARAEHDVEVSALIEGVSEKALRYQQIEAWRSLISRWDGRIGIPGAATARPSAEASSADGPAL